MLQRIGEDTLHEKKTKQIFIKNDVKSDNVVDKVCHFHILPNSSCHSILNQRANSYTAQKMKFSLKDFFSTCDQTAVSCNFIKKDQIQIKSQIRNLSLQFYLKRDSGTEQLY